MNVVVTAGGTSEAWDEVRVLSNRSTGRTGAMIAEACLRRGACVDYLHAASAQIPLARLATFDLLTQELETEFDRLRDLQHQWRESRPRLRLIPLRDGSVDEYSRLLEKSLRSSSIDVVFLTMAVSDFAPVRVAGKIDSTSLTNSSGEILLRLRRTPKVIRSVRDWSPTSYLVGFKLLSGASEQQLIEAATRATTENRVDLTVANDYHTVLAGRHEMHLVRSGVDPERLAPGADLLSRLVDRVFTWAEERHSRH